MGAWLPPGQHGQEEVGPIPGSLSEGLDQSHLQFSDPTTLLPTVRNSEIPVFSQMCLRSLCVLIDLPKCMCGPTVRQTEAVAMEIRSGHEKLHL